MINKFTLIFVFLITFVSAAEPQPDHQIFDRLLKKFVKENLVDYSGFLDDRKILQDYLKQFDSVSISKLNKSEQLALFINAYNAFTIELILENYSLKLKSINDIKKPWDIKFCSIEGKKYSLNDIENHFLREKLKEPRIHFAINCASISCPPLQVYAFSPEKIEEQLTEVTFNFMKNPLGVKVNKEVFEISKIFNWFKVDFESKDKTIISFILQYLSPEIKKNISDISKITIKYQEYNWNLNEWKGEGK